MNTNTRLGVKTAPLFLQISELLSTNKTLKCKSIYPFLYFVDASISEVELAFDKKDFYGRIESNVFL